MKHTKHLKTRMNQRGITKDIIDLAMQFGETNGEKCVLNKKDALKLIDEINQWKHSLMRMVQKGGVVVVHDQDTVITTYNNN